MPPQDNPHLHLIPDDTTTKNNVFCYAALADKQMGTLYTHAMGALPAVTFERNQYYFIMYDYDTNYIHASPVQNLKDKTLINKSDTIFLDFTACGHKLLFNVTDNQTFTPLKAYLQQHDYTWQFVEPSNHLFDGMGNPIIQKSFHQWFVLH